MIDNTNDDEVVLINWDRAQQRSLNFELSYLSALREDLQYKHMLLPPEK